MKCLGCKLANEEDPIYKIYEDDYVTCFLDHAPFYAGHTLIVPKQHVVEVDELDDCVAKAIMDASKVIAKAIKLLYKPDGITICPALTGSKTPTLKFSESKEVRWGIQLPVKARLVQLIISGR